MTIDHIRISQQAKEQLIKLKRVTGVQQWNVLCRWALCVSLAERSVPPAVKIPADSNVEMTWKVFGGRYSDVYLVLLKERCILDGHGTDPETLIQQLRLHLHRGIAYLSANRSLKAVDNLIAVTI